MTHLTLAEQIARATEQHDDAQLALTFTILSVIQARDSIALATETEHEQIDRLAAEVVQRRLALARLRRRAQDPTLCPVCGNPKHREDPSWYPVTIQHYGDDEQGTKP